MTRLLALCLLLLAGCPAYPNHEITFVGQIYDGATGTRLTSFTLKIRYGDKVITATVDREGRFLVKGLPVFQDYTVEIEASGYRPFRSHNARFNPPPFASLTDGAQSTSQTFYFDAYLFPSALVAQALTLNVRKLTTSGEVASGKVRIRPVAMSELADDPTNEIPSGVTGQIWFNDEDLQAKTIQRDFADGKIEIAAGELPYGVRFQVLIYEVQGYQPDESFITAGTDGTKTIVLEEELTDPLTIVMETSAGCMNPTGPTDTNAGAFSIEFNFDIEFGMTTYTGGVLEMIDDPNVFQMQSTDLTPTLTINSLKADALPTARERGTSAVINGRTLTFSWNAVNGLMTNDPNDPMQIRWYVAQVPVQPIGRPGQRRTLQQFAGSFPNLANQIFCN